MIKIGVIGKGCIGSYITYLLQDQNTSVFVRNPSQTNPQIVISDKQHKILGTQLALTQDNLHQIDLLIIPIKSYQNDTLIQQLLPILHPSTELLILQNGIHWLTQYANAFPHNPILGGIVTDGLFKQSKDTIVLAGQGELILGALKGANQKSLAPLIHAHQNAQWVEDLQPFIYKKLLINIVINSLTFLYQCKNGELKDYPEQVAALKKEVLQTYLALGIIDSTAQLASVVENVIESTQHNRSSMLQDRLAKAPSEVDAILGCLLEKAKAAKIPTPLMSCYLDKIKTIERQYVTA
ncbi:ketopantoate reductase family protein [Glaciecola sp. 1036]|uniref:ketopantoate reductase family protein n=1 Tax=Alteromonadaceae TaxID=72275 RepID=UPI003D02B631